MANRQGGHLPRGAKRSFTALLGCLSLTTAWCFGPPSALADPIEVPFSIDGDGRLVVALGLPGGPLRTVVDTGLNAHLVIEPEAAKRTTVRVLPFGGGRTRGVDGLGQRPKLGFAKIVRLGPAQGDWDVPAIVVGSPILKHDAMLGMGFLSKYDVDFDFSARSLSLSPPARTSSGSAKAFHNCAPTKPALSLSGRCGADMVYIDTGGRRSVINQQMARRMELSPRLMTEAAPITGAEGRDLPARRYSAPVEIAGVRLDSVLVADFPGRGGCKAACAEAILGMDALGRLSRMSLTRSRITLQP